MRQGGTLKITLIISVVLHTAFIGFVKFSPPDLKKLKDALPTLEVMLVNTKTKTAPKKADILAQANLDRGGNTSAKRRMKSALPLQQKSKNELHQKPNATVNAAAQAMTLDTEIQHQELQIAALEKQSQVLMTKIKSEKSVETKSNHTATLDKPENSQQHTPVKSLNTENLIAASIEIARLEAAIAKQQEAYQERPRTKYIGARAKEDRFAFYVDAWRQKVEKIGNLNYPEAAKEQKLYGQLLLTVLIKADGSIENIKIDRSSGHKILDEAAKKIVELGAPFAQFPDDIRKDTDILSITRTWTFTREDNLTTGF